MIPLSASLKTKITSLKVKSFLVFSYDERLSLAHPNEHIIPETEAMYVINLIRSLLYYFEMKVTAYEKL